MRKLRRIRAEKGLTMDTLEERTGVSKRTISEIERGMRTPQTLTLAKLANALDVDLDDLLEEEAPKAPGPTLQLEIEEQRGASEERRDSLNELGEIYRDTREGVNRLSAIWEERLATGDLDRASVEEFVENTWALVPALRDVLTSELGAVAGILAMGEEEMLDEDGSFSSELLSLSTLDPVVDRYFTVGRRVVEVWETRFAGEAEAASNVTYLFDRARAPSRHRQVG